MTVLSSVRIHFKILGVIPLSKKDLPSVLQPYKTAINLVYNVFWHISLATYMLTVLCFLKFDAETFIQYAETGFFCSVISLHLASHEIFLQTRSKLMILFKDADNLVKKRIVDSLIRDIYTEQDENMNKLSSSLLKSGLIFAQLFLLPKTVTSFYLYNTTDLGADAFMPLFPSMIPWNWKTPSGYMADVCVTYIWIHCGIYSVICSIPLFAGFCSLFEAFTVDICRATTRFNDAIIEARQETSPHTSYNLFRKLTTIARFHSEAKELAARYSEVYGSLIAVSFAVSSGFLCSSLLGLNASTTIEDILRFLVCLSVMMIYLVLLCIMGDDVTISFQQVHHSIWECTWYELPQTSQKLYPLILAAAQKPVFIQGHVNTKCTRESAKKLINSAVSAFMVLREFDH